VLADAAEIPGDIAGLVDIGFFFVKYILNGLLVSPYWLLSQLRSGQGVSFKNTFNQFSDLFLNRQVLFLEWETLITDIADECLESWDLNVMGTDVFGAMILFRLERQHKDRSNEEKSYDR
jgi:hypothetical protein